MTITKKKRQFSYLLIIISGLLLAVIVTTTVVLLKKPTDHADASSGDEPLVDNSAQPSAVDISSPLVEHNESTTTFEAAAAHTTDSNQETNTNQQTNTNQEACRDPRIRKSWTELSNNEQSRFFNAVIQMKSRPAHTNAAPNRYDEFAALHDTYKSFAHNLVFLS